MGNLKIDTMLYRTKTLKGILMDNYAIEQNEHRPLNEFRDIVKEHAREYAKGLIDSGLAINGGTVSKDEMLEIFEKEFYGE